MELSEIRGRVQRISEDERPENPRFSIENMESSVDPIKSFYSYCNGSWIRSHPIPADKVRWGAFAQLVDRNKYILGKILEDCAFVDHPESQLKEQIGSFYLSAMDTKTIERLGFEPIKDYMEMIDRIADKKGIIPLVSRLHSSGIPVMFSYSSDGDEKNSSTYAYYLRQGGLSLPNRDYYLLDQFEGIRKDYVTHIANIFSIYGYSREESESSSGTVIDIELGLARVSRTPVELRDPEKNYNRFPFEELQARLPGLDVRRYLSDIQLPAVPHIVVRQPEFFENLGKMLKDVPLESWKVYLKWKVLHFASPYLHEAARDETFDFFERKLFGRKKQEKRWKTVVDIIDGQLGEALGKLYVEQQFGEDSKSRMEEMVNDLREVFYEKLTNISWMSELTRKKALEKFSKFRAKIGFPSKFIDYSSIEVFADDFFGNVLRSNEFEFRREIGRINSPVDRELWQMTPPTVNAYFSPTDNEIVFPAGILQPPFFDPDIDDAVNYGATGGIIAHEITHGFDDEGRKYDLNGNLNDWWSKEDADEFTKRAKSVVNLYGSIEVLPGLKVNGDLTLGENIADLGGISIAYEALDRRLKRDPSRRRIIDGLTPEQRFYIGWSQSWRGNIREEALKWQISNDPHSPDNIRGEIPVRVHYMFRTHFNGGKDRENRNDGIITIW